MKRNPWLLVAALLVAWAVSPCDAAPKAGSKTPDIPTLVKQLP